MDPNAFPTKANLMKAKNSLALSRQGYDLMDKKRNILIKELMELIDKAADIQSEIDVSFTKAYAAYWTAIRYGSDHIFNYIELGQEYAIFEIQVPENWKGKTIGRLDIRQKYNINIMALKIEGRMDMSITSDTVLSGNMTMLVLGKNKDIQKCFHIL